MLSQSNLGSMTLSNLFHVSRIINVAMPFDPVILLLGIYLQGTIQHIGGKEIFE